MAIAVYSSHGNRSLRVVDLPEYLANGIEKYLQYLRKENLKTGREGDVDLLFEDPDEKGGLYPLNQRKARRLIERVCKTAGLRVRHPPRPQTRQSDYYPVYVQHQLGHSSIAIRVDRYCHWIPGEGRGDLEGALRGQGPKAKEKSLITQITNRKSCKLNDYSSLN